MHTYIYIYIYIFKKAVLYNIYLLLLTKIISHCYVFTIMLNVMGFSNGWLFGRLFNLIFFAICGIRVVSWSKWAFYSRFQRLWIFLPFKGRQPGHGDAFEFDLQESWWMVQGGAERTGRHRPSHKDCHVLRILFGWLCFLGQDTPWHPVQNWEVSQSPRKCKLINFSSSTLS